MEYVLQTDGLCKYYKHFKALNNLNMNIPKGAIYGFVGRNGAGKTTLIRLICGLQNPTSGTFILYGKRNDDREITKMRSRCGAVVETPSVYLNMTAEENLKQQYLILGMPSYEGISKLLELVGLTDTGRKKVKNFSLGMRQRLGIAAALCANPDFLILDEPTNGLDPQGIIEIRELILKLNREQEITFLISSHILDELSRIATHFGFIDKGCIVKEISAEELDKTCRKWMHLTVSNVKALSRALDQKQIPYRVISEKEADIFDEISISDLVISLKAEDCEVFSVYEKDETLENYFINLVGRWYHEPVYMAGCSMCPSFYTGLWSAL